MKDIQPENDYVCSTTGIDFVSSVTETMSDYEKYSIHCFYVDETESIAIRW